MGERGINWSQCVEDSLEEPWHFCLRIWCSISKTEHGALSLYDFIVLKVFLCECNDSG